jgi:superfamily II helicase
MGIEWLSLREFEQTLGRAGRPDYHDKGTVYLLVEPDRSYHDSTEMTEDEAAFKLPTGEMEDGVTRNDETAAARVVAAFETPPTAAFASARASPRTRGRCRRPTAPRRQLPRPAAATTPWTPPRRRRSRSVPSVRAVRYRDT